MGEPFLVRLLREGSGLNKLRMALLLVVGPPIGLVLLFAIPFYLPDYPITDPGNWLLFLLWGGLLLLFLVWPVYETVRLCVWVVRGLLDESDGGPETVDGGDRGRSSPGNAADRESNDASPEWRLEYGLGDDRERERDS